MKQRVKEKVLERMDLSREVTDEEIYDMIDEEIIAESKKHYISLKEKGVIRREVFNSIRRLDILQELVEDSSITEIMINGPEKIFIEQDGVLKRWNKKFESAAKLEDVVQQIVSRGNRIINEANPIVDVRLSDGSRVNVVLPPIAMEGPAVTIRKFPKNPITMERLIELESITPEVSSFLEKLVVSQYNILIGGGTGSGKTTFLNVLSNYIPQDERIITIEDSAELQIRNIPNLVGLEVRNANVEGNHEVSIRELIKTSLRMRPSRIIIGEVRDASACDLMSAFNTGHDGSLSSIHANSPADMLSRLESLVLMGMEIPLLAVRKQIAAAVDIIIHLGRLRDKTRRVLAIVEVLDCEEGEIALNPLYIFQEKGEKEDGHIFGELVSTGNHLIQMSKMRKAGIDLL